MARSSVIILLSSFLLVAVFMVVNTSYYNKILGMRKEENRISSESIPFDAVSENTFMKRSETENEEHYERSIERKKEGDSEERREEKVESSRQDDPDEDMAGGSSESQREERAYKSGTDSGYTAHSEKRLEKLIDRGHRCWAAAATGFGPPFKTSQYDIFIDLGANDGRSVQYYFDKVRGLKVPLSENAGQSNYETYMFEINPKFKEKLEAQCDRLGTERHFCRVVLAAAWTRYGTVDFYEDKRKVVNKKKKLGVYDAVGSSLVDRGDTSGRMKPRKGDQGCCSVDFSDWLATLMHTRNLSTHPYRHVFVKMDIEGAEYSLLDHLITTDGLKFVNELAVEWHPQVVKDGEPRKRMDLISRIKALKNVKLVEWEL